MALQRIPNRSYHPFYSPTTTRKVVTPLPKSKEKTPRIFLVKPDKNLKDTAKQIFDLMSLSFPGQFDGSVEGNMKVESIEYCIKRKKIFVFAMKINSQIIGFIIGEPHNSVQSRFVWYGDDMKMPRKKKSYYTTMIAVHPDHRRKHYAQRLRCRLIKHLKDIGIYYLTCHIRVKRGSYDTQLEKIVKEVKLSYILDNYQSFYEPFQYLELKL
jgi:ribosomal protein S18 acetylase RimI-like enzyme